MRNGLLAFLAAVAFAATPVSANMVMSSTGGGGPPPGIAFVQSVGDMVCGSASTCAQTITGTTTGHLFVVSVWAENSSLITFTGVSNSGTACTRSPGTQANVAGDFSLVYETEIWYCQNNPAGGSRTITATASGTATDILMCTAEFSGANTSGADSGLGSATANASTSSLSMTVSGNITQNNALIYSSYTVSTSAATGHGPNQTLDGCGNSYQLTDTSGTAPTHTYTYGSSQTNIGSIAAFYHP
jgi:hypothetical protein